MGRVRLECYGGETGIAVDPAKLDVTVGSMAGDRGAIADSVPVLIGDKLGLAAAGPSAARLILRSGPPNGYRCSPAQRP
jgi:hypothetical protein